MCSVHRGMFSTSGDVQYIEGDIMSTLGDVQYIGGILWYMWGSNLIKSFQFLLKTPMYWTSPNVLMVSLWCTEHPPIYWTSLGVLNTHYTGCSSLVLLLHTASVRLLKNEPITRMSQRHLPSETRQNESTTFTDWNSANEQHQTTYSIGREFKD